MAHNQHNHAGAPLVENYTERFTVGDEALQAGLEGPRKNLIPNSDKVLFHTNILSPVTSETTCFEAPFVPGVCTYVCAFPGHALA